MFRNAEADSSGWLQRARRLLEGTEPSFELGLLNGMEGFIALQFRHDVARARHVSVATLEIAQALHSVDLEILALSQEGFALVREGQVLDGMRRLDEATTAALAGEVSNLDAIITACCFLSDACEHVRDLTRTAQWCEKMQEFCVRYSYNSMLAYCRTHHANLLLWRGAWEEAEEVPISATTELTVKRAGLAPRGFLALAELPRRQGRSEDAASLYERVSGQPFATLGFATLAVDAGDLFTARDLVERFLRQIPIDERIERSTGLALAVRIHSASSNLESARAVLNELEDSASSADCPPLRFAVVESRGYLAVATGDLDAARRAFEDAVDLHQQSGEPYETACTRIELARILAGLGRQAQAIVVARQTADALRDLGAMHESARAATLLDELQASTQPLEVLDSPPAGLTRREAEVLTLLAQGKSNHEIAADLYLSVRTVERHISAIYAKIGANGPAARAVATTFALSRGLVSVTDL
jgi:DNA-binding CsgD family transcriptional regulator